jgi:hypothetical protein
MDGTVMYIEIRDPHSGKLLCRYDPDRALLEFQHKHAKTIVDLTQYQSASELPVEPSPAPEPAK